MLHKSTIFASALILSFKSFAGMNLSTEQDESRQDQNRSTLTTTEKVGATLFASAIGAAVIGAAIYNMTEPTQEKREAPKKLMPFYPRMQSSDSSDESASESEDEFTRTFTSLGIPSPFVNSKIVKVGDLIQDKVPTINLSIFDEPQLESGKIDLHPSLTRTPYQTFKQQFYDHYREYVMGHTDDRRLHIITGTGIKRSSQPYRLQNDVQTWLRKPYFEKRIEKVWLSKPGFFTIIFNERI